jgi:hypothetical protein
MGKPTVGLSVNLSAPHKAQPMPRTTGETNWDNAPENSALLVAFVVGLHVQTASAAGTNCCILQINAGRSSERFKRIGNFYGRKFTRPSEEALRQADGRCGEIAAGSVLAGTAPR